ncbi:M16 family metallopeptidase [Dyadobacter helix]|nr:pitrilysin family protein [Dyadobacter sp. CECT 9275]
MLLDRTVAPDYQIIKTIELPEADSYTLENGGLLHVINIGDQPVVRLEVIFDAGNWYEKYPSSSFFAIKMLTEGTATRTSAETSEAFERIGAFTDMTHSSDRAGMVVYCLTRFLPEVLGIVTDLVQHAAFPEKELADLKNITLQNLRVNLEKTAYVATSEFRAAIFGQDHPYGQSQNEADILSLERYQVLEHYNSFINKNKYTVILAGQVSANDVELVRQSLGQASLTADVSVVTRAVSAAYEGKEVLVEKQDSVQSSIRIGRRMFTRDHADYFKMLVTNEIFGGYFGSRLMKNIREEKGLTYGISSHMVTLSREGYIMIGTDVKKEFTQQTIDEIKKEMFRLQTELVSEEELQTVKNFMSGELAGSLNTAFEVADRQKVLLLEGLPSDFFSRYVEQIHATTSQDVIAMANKYLRPETMVEVVVGGK